MISGGPVQSYFSGLGLSLHPKLGSAGAEALLEAASSCRNLNSLELAGSSAPPPILSAVQLALTPDGKITPSVDELWAAGVHSAFTLRAAPPEVLAAGP